MGRMKECDIRIRGGGDDAVAAAGELLPRWTLVSEQLPTPYQWVLVWSDCPPVPYVCYWCPVEKWDHRANPNRPIDPTHWMPLPQNPTVEP